MPKMQESRSTLLEVSTAGMSSLPGNVALYQLTLSREETYLALKDVDLVREEMPGKQAGTELEAGVGMQSEKEGKAQSEDVELQDGDLSAEEREFLEQFPKWKKEQEVVIEKLYALAEDIDTTHKRIIKSKVVTSSAALASGVMSLLGLALAPATMGASIILTIAGQGLGAVAGVANIATNVWEHSLNKEARAEASTLVPTSDQELEKVEREKTSYVTAAGKIAYDCGSTLDAIRKHTRALRLARAHPRLARSAKRLMTTGQVSARSTKQVQKAFGGTALAMTKEARMLGGATAVFFLGLDAADLVKEWKKLKEGTRAELAEELREHARELEEMVWESTRDYNRLWQKKRLQEKKHMGWLRRLFSG